MGLWRLGVGLRPSALLAALVHLASSSGWSQRRRSREAHEANRRHTAITDEPLEFPRASRCPRVVRAWPASFASPTASVQRSCEPDRRERVWIGDPGPCVVGRDPHPLVTRWLGLVARRPLAFRALARAAGASGASRGGTSFAHRVASWWLGAVRRGRGWRRSGLRLPALRRTV